MFDEKQALVHYVNLFYNWWIGLWYLWVVKFTTISSFLFLMFTTNEQIISKNMRLFYVHILFKQHTCKTKTMNKSLNRGITWTHTYYEYNSSKKTRDEIPTQITKRVTLRIFNSWTCPNWNETNIYQNLLGIHKMT